MTGCFMYFVLELIFIFLINFENSLVPLSVPHWGGKDIEGLKVILSLKLTKRKEGIKVNIVITSITPN